MRRICRTGLWQRYSEEAAILVSWLDFSPEELECSRQIHVQFPGEQEIESITWFLPDFHHAFFGGIYTILRFADYMTRQHQVWHQFVIVGTLPEKEAHTKIVSAFPGLRDSNICRVNLNEDLSSLRPTDAAIATLWSTAYFLLRFNETKRKFYFIQDYEPLFYPAGSTYAQVEASLRFGFYGIANTPTIRKIYEEQYGGLAKDFFPCVDAHVFYPPEPMQVTISGKQPYRLFFYGRPGHPRNGFELGTAALRILKGRLQDRLQILSAGAKWDPQEFDLMGVVENLGLISFEGTADLYRSCDAGLVMMFTRHPSYLPFELMASGVLVVTNFNPTTTWMLKDGENCLLSEASPTCLADTLERGLLDHALRHQITLNAVNEIRTHYQDWDSQIEKIYAFVKNPSR
jgi:glycosyltransferase involved in cell wall biosynthesis